MYGVTFGDEHSRRDWGLITKSRPVISSPSPKTNYIDIPEADGQLDLTESLSGEVKFDNRKITCEFIVIEARKRWTTIYSEIMNYLHGQKMKVILDEDPNHYYMGRCTIDSWKSDKKTSTLTIICEVDPYKYDITGSLENWKWDSFNFEQDYIREYKELTVDEELNFTVYGSRRSSVPEFIVHSEDGSGMKVKFNNQTYDLQDGKNRVVNITIKDGANSLTFLGKGTVSIDYHGGSL